MVRRGARLTGSPTFAPSEASPRGRAPARRWPRCGAGGGPQPVEDLEVDRLALRPELQEEHVPVEREQVDHDPVQAVAQAPRRPPLLVLLERLELAAEGRRDGPAGLDPERAQDAL